MNKTIDVIVVGQTPPPFHGQAIMIEMLVQAQFEDLRLHHVRMAFSNSIDDVGRFQISKVLHLFALVFRIILARVRYRATILYYPPAGPSPVPLVRDVIILLATRWMFRKVVFHFQASGISELISRLPALLKLPVRWALFQPDAAIQLSDLVRKDAAFIQARRIYTIPNAARIPNPNFGSENKGCDDAAAQGPTSLLYLGTVCRTKGILILIEACRILLDRKIPFHLNIVGGFQPINFRQEVESHIETAGLAPWITIHGQKTGDHKWKLLHNADVFCFPTYYEAEGFPCVLVEALVCGLPLIATRWRGIPSIVDDGINGFLTEIHDSKAIADSIEKLASDPQLRQRMGQAGRKKFQESFTEERHLSLMADVFRDLAS